MERLNLFAFKVRAFFQSLIYLFIRLFSAKGANKYLEHINNSDEKFGIKAIRKEWALVLCEQMRYFCRLPKFRRELILSELNDVFVLDLIRSMKIKDLSESELELIALNRKFDECGTESLYWFKVKLFGSKVENKNEIIKIFYKNSKEAEKSDILSEMLLKDFENDLDFLCWHALNGGSDVIKQAFIKKLLFGVESAESKKRLRTFVEKVGLIGCDVEKLNGYSELLLDIREYLTRPEDIEIWEYYLLKGKNPEIIKLHVRRHGIESKNGLKMLLELNNKDVTDAYNFHNSVGKRLTS